MEIKFVEICLKSPFRGKSKGLTCMGLAATNIPASPPPITRPSGPANETLNPPVLPFTPPLSLTVNEPARVNISKRPCKVISNFNLN